MGRPLYIIDTCNIRRGISELPCLFFEIRGGISDHL